MKVKKLFKGLLKVLSIIICAVLVFGCFSAVANKSYNKNITEYAASFKPVEIDNQLIPEKDADGNWTFTTDRELKIMHLTDIHLGGGWIPKKNDTLALNAVAQMITVEKPDLVVITGDIVYPVPYQSGAFNNLPPHETFATLMESLGVYWTVTFGNHDSEFYSTYTREEVSDFYSDSDFRYCLYEDVEGLYGSGNSVINVKNSQGIITQSIFTLDSNAYTGEGLIETLAWEYDNIHEDQIEWYKTTVEANNEYNKNLIATLDNKDELLSKYEKLNTLLFFHIPIAEYGDAWFEYVENGYKDTEDVKFMFGTAGESGDVVYSSDIPDNLFETMLELGGTHGTFCGHDHVNNFSIEYKGIRLTYGLSVDYLAYLRISSLGSQRGCTMITVQPDGTFDCTQENYYQDKYAHDLREEVTMQVLNEDHK
jgi:predicted MPP superfamily phosphohydrolase